MYGGAYNVHDTYFSLSLAKVVAVAVEQMTKYCQDHILNNDLQHALGNQM